MRRRPSLNSMVDLFVLTFFVLLVLVLAVAGCATSSHYLSAQTTSSTSPAVLHLYEHWGCTRTRAQLGLGGPFRSGIFRPEIPCTETCADRYGLPDTYEGKDVRWELVSGASPHSRGALPILETLLRMEGDPLNGNGITHLGSDSLAEQDLSLLHCGQTPAYTWLSTRLRAELGGPAKVVSHESGDSLSVNGELRAGGCVECDWSLTVRRRVAPAGPFDSGIRRERLSHKGAVWQLSLPSEWAGNIAVVEVQPQGKSRLISSPIELKLVKQGNTPPEEPPSDPIDPVHPGTEPNPEPGSQCEEALDILERALQDARQRCS